MFKVSFKQLLIAKWNGSILWNDHLAFTIVPIQLILSATAVVGLDENNLATEYGVKIQKDKTNTECLWMSDKEVWRTSPQRTLQCIPAAVEIATQD